MTHSTIPNIIIYQAPNGAIELKGDFDKETVWASLDQIASFFGRDKSVISRHIKNIFRDGELEKDSVIAFFATTANDGKTYTVEYFNLDVLISVGYRVNSVVATQFRKWATKTLKAHITKGYTINKTLLQKNFSLFEQALNDIQTLSYNTISSHDVLELVKAFSHTWFSLDAFDKEHFELSRQTPQSLTIEAQKLSDDLAIFKQELISKQQATELFAPRKRSRKSSWDPGGCISSIWRGYISEHGVQGISSSLFHRQNHPFTDGNKRSGAFAFIWFLQKVGYHFRHKITPEALTAITLIIAISDPKEKQKMINLVILLLSGK